METQSPPKRVTRARAAATTTKTDPSIRIVTSGMKARAPRAAPAAPTKRNTRTDGANDSEVIEETNTSEPERPKTRGRPKKLVTPLADEELQIEEDMKLPAKPTRGRPKKAVEDVDGPETSRASRVRVKPTQQTVPDEQDQSLKSARGRASMVAKAKAPSKKTVKFQEAHEPDKENILPTIPVNVKGKQVELGTGLKAKPIRKPATAPRATRGRAKALEEPEAPKEKSPLSPKKATQVATAKDSGSEDELATMEKTPMKMLTRSPLKVAEGMFGTAKRLEFNSPIIANRVIPSSQRDLSTSMGSPARRIPQSPFKDSLKTSPKRLNLGDSTTTSHFKPSVSGLATLNSQFKASLLQSPARRPPSPIKNFGPASPVRSGPLKGSPKAHTFSVSRFATPGTLNKSASRHARIPFASVGRQSASIIHTNTNQNFDSTSIRPFSGRLSSILPRNENQALREDLDSPDNLQAFENLAVTSIEEDESSVDPLSTDLMKINDAHVNDPATEDRQSTTPTQPPTRHGVGGNFGPLNPEDVDPFEDTDSEDELASDSPSYTPVPFSNFKNLAAPSKPIPFNPISKTPMTALKQRPQSEYTQDAPQTQSTHTYGVEVGFTPLARQFSDWMAPSPEAFEEQVPFPVLDSCDQPFGANFNENIEPLPGQSSFFDDEMLTMIEAAGNDTVLGAIDFAPTELDDEDLALAAEADEMSLIDIQEVDDAVDLVTTALPADTLSEASQEYGDENAIPIDPELLRLDVPLVFAVAPRFETPTRVLTERVFHTVSKVPLKPAAEESPMKNNSHKRSASASKLPVPRPAPLSAPRTRLDECKTSEELYTPAKSMAWSTTATPNRTPRSDLNDQVLRGAVVFVDVHTTEGADASAVFVELLGQMGAKCVKTWTWNANGNGSSPETSEGITSSKIGITHVVFKDGGKRTLEKVRESKGVVLCVGVGWVLDCERSNAWLEEAPYTIDTMLVPRGGQRRRKSMEPRALANMNGMLVSTPGRTASGSYTMSPTKEFLNIPDTPGTSLKLNRRASVQWVRSPSQGDDADMPALSPVPATPAPEAVSAYAEHVLDCELSGGETPYLSRKEDLVQWTAPPKQSVKGYGELQGVSGTESGVLMQRLLLARRKSLQWAPKVGSPLARSASFAP